MVKTMRIFLAMLALLPWLSGCLASNPPEPPVTLPFAVHRAGNTITTKLRVIAHRKYFFFLTLGFDPNDPKERSRVEKMVGSGATDKNGAPIDYGISIPIRLTISTINTLGASGERVIYSKEIRKEPLCVYSFDSYSKSAALVELKPGLYRIRAKSLENIPELARIPVSLEITWAPLTTPID